MKRRLRNAEPFDKEAADRSIQAGHGLHPLDPYLKPGRIPHIWCPGCGLGVVLTTYIEAMRRKDIPVNRCAVVSGIGCTGRVAGYLDMDTYHTTHGRRSPYRSSLARPDLYVMSFPETATCCHWSNHLIRPRTRTSKCSASTTSLRDDRRTGRARRLLMQELTPLGT
jgi:hypothetical protein